MVPLSFVLAADSTGRMVVETATTEVMTWVDWALVTLYDIVE